MGFFVKIDKIFGRQHYQKGPSLFVTSASQCSTFNHNVLDRKWAMTSRTLWLIRAR